jgi:superfamily II DNA helicase RecQ
MDDYGRMLARLICFLLRSYANRDFKWTIQHPYWNSTSSKLRVLDGLCSARPVNKLSIRASIHELLSELFSWRDERIVEEVKCPIYRFVIAALVNTSATGFLTAKGVTPIISKLQYCIRANVYQQIMDRDKSGGYLLSDDGGLYGLRKFVIEDGHTPFNRLRQLMHKATAVANSGPKLPQVSWKGDYRNPRDYSVLEVNGKSLPVKAIQDLRKSLIKENEQRLNDKLLIGVNRDELPSFDAYEVSDILSSQAWGYSVFESKDNEFHKYRNHVIDSWLSQGRLRSHFTRGRTGEGKICWNRANVVQYLGWCKDFIEDFLVEMHLDYGMPGRATEIANMKIINTGEGQRNLYWKNYTIMLLFLYSKTRSRKDTDRMIPRFLSPEVKKQLMMYMTFIRPTMSYLIKALGGLEGETDVDEYLFMDHVHGRWDGERVRTVFKSVTSRNAIGLLEFSTYRQAADLMMEKLIKYKVHGINENCFFDMQMGHSSLTAEVSYAVAKDDSNVATKTAIHEFWIVTGEWWKVMNAISTRIPDTGEHAETTETTRTSSSGTEISSIIIDLPRLEYKETTKSVKMPDRTVNPYVEIKPETLVSLRALFNNTSARFKSVEQASACQWAVNRTGDGLVILETGGGKSLIIELPASMERDKTTVVIVPFVGLLTEMKSRFGRLNLIVEEWTRERMDTDQHPNLIMVSAEEAVTDEFKRYLTEVSNLGRLSRIIIDEAHVIITQRNFRPWLGRLVCTVRAVRVPVIMLTATCPPSMEEDLRRSLACMSWTVFRRSINRPNLEYKVVKVSGKRQMEVMDWTICDMINKAMNSEMWKAEDRIIVYCLTKDDCRDLSGLINRTLKQDISGFYHSKLSKEEKELAYQRWMNGQIKILVATGAFGAGIDYAFVRNVFHRGHASSQINYIQETGRAGRDGGRGECVTVYCKEAEDESDWMKDPGRETNLRYIRSCQCRRGTINEEMNGVRVDCLMYSESRMCDICVKSLEMTVPRCRASQRSDWDSYDDDGAQGFYRLVTNEQYKLISGVKDLMKLLSGNCVACFMKDNRKIQHSVNSCPGLEGMCSRCLGWGHVARDCDQSIKYICGCRTCGFPQNLYGEYMHGDAGTGECNMIDVRHVILTGTICLFKLSHWRRRILVSKFGLSEMISKEELIWWISMSSDGEICNGLLAMIEWMNLRLV